VHRVGHHRVDPTLVHREEWRHQVDGSDPDQQPGCGAHSAVPAGRPPDTDPEGQRQHAVREEKRSGLVLAGTGASGSQGWRQVTPERGLRHAHEAKGRARQRGRGGRQLGDQITTLTRARSVTARVLTEAEHAQNHVQVGNLGLALRVIDDWLDSVTSRELKGDPATTQ
jgi:hypothetical protein